MEDLIDAMAKHYKPASSLTRERLALLHMKQGTETVEAYATRLRLAMGNCQLDHLEDDLTRVVFIDGLTSDLMMERLLEDPESSFEQTVERATAMQNRLPRAGQSNGSSERCFSPQGQRSSPIERNREVGRPNTLSTTETRSPRFRSADRKEETTPPRFRSCEYPIFSSGHRCPAVNAKCNRCGGQNHFASVYTKMTKRSL